MRDRPRRPLHLARPRPARRLPDPRPARARQGPAPLRPRPRARAGAGARRPRHRGARRREGAENVGVWVGDGRRARSPRSASAPHGWIVQARLRPERRSATSAAFAALRRLRAARARVHLGRARAGPPRHRAEARASRVLDRLGGGPGAAASSPFPVGTRSPDGRCAAASPSSPRTSRRPARFYARAARPWSSRRTRTASGPASTA